MRVNESNNTRLTQQSNRTTQGSDDDIDIEGIASRTRESDGEREGEREMERNGKVKEKREEREQQEEKQKREEKGNTKDTETENESIYHKQAQGPDQQTATMLA